MKFKAFIEHSNGFSELKTKNSITCENQVSFFSILIFQTIVNTNKMVVALGYLQLCTEWHNINKSKII